MPSAEPLAIRRDLGFAVRRKVDDATEIMIGFTLCYAHPALAEFAQNVADLKAK